MRYKANFLQSVTFFYKLKLYKKEFLWRNTEYIDERGKVPIFAILQLIKLVQNTVHWLMFCVTKLRRP